MNIVNTMLRSKYFYNNIEKFVNMGIVIKEDKKYIFENNIIEYVNDFIYVNDKKINKNIEVYERGYLDYLNNKDFSLKEVINFDREIDFLIWKAEKSYPTLLYKIVEKDVDKTK